MSGAEPKDVRTSSSRLVTRDTRQTLTPAQQDDTSTAILKKKKKPNQLMYVSLVPFAAFARDVR